MLERTHYYKPAAIIKDLAGMNRVVIAEKKRQKKSKYFKASYP